MPDLTLEVAYESGEFCQSHHSHWGVLPKKPIARLWVRGPFPTLEIPPAAEFALVDPPPKGPITIFALDHRGGRVWGRSWTFAANSTTPEVRVIDGEVLDGPGVPPRACFIPGVFGEFVPPPHRGAANALRSRLRR